jgi:Mrp family chromosome partitioning ATPase
VASGPFGEGYECAHRAQLLLAKASRSWCVTSTVPSEGKTLTSVNLALASPRGSRAVLLVDGDLRKPASHAMPAAPLPGLSTSW